MESILWPMAKLGGLVGSREMSHRRSAYSRRELTRTLDPYTLSLRIPESGDEDLDALREKLRAELLSHIGRSPLGNVRLRFDELLDVVSRGVYGLWRDRQSLQGQVNTTVGSIVSSLTEESQAVTVRTDEMVLSLGSEEERGVLMERIRVADVPPGLPEGRQLPLQDTSDGD